MTRRFATIVVLFALGGCDRDVELDLGSPVQAQEGSPRLACYQAAEEETNLSADQSFALCREAESTAPVACHVAADDRLNMSIQQAVELCRCARSTEPVECSEIADRDTDLSEQAIVELCAARCPYSVAPYGS